MPHGLHREWHENGVLASEVYLKDAVPDGIGRQWDKDGNLILSYEIKNGTGIQKAWFADQGCWAEISWVNGSMTGRHRTYWIDDGTVVGDIFWIKNRKVSKKRYFEACKTDPNLPRYEDPPAQAPSHVPPTTCPPADMDDLPKSILSSGNALEALAWLKEPSVPERSLGEATTQEDSIELVESLYNAGAVTVWVFDIDGELSEEQNSGRLLVELPSDPAKRESILAKCAEIGAEQGFDAEPDTGQYYTVLMLD